MEKDYIPVSNSLSWKGKFDYSLSCEDSHSPPHYTYVYIYGNEYIELRIYNYKDNKYERYRSKIKIDGNEMKQLLSQEK